MSILGVIALDLGILYFFFGSWIVRKCRSKRGRICQELKEYEKTLRDYELRDRDILPLAQAKKIQDELADIRSIRLGADESRQSSKLAELEKKGFQSLIPRKSFGWLRGHLEVLVVALGVAFGIRSLCIQPFKIPTGSMQPTLYGIHFVPTAEAPSSSAIGRFFSYWNFSRSAVDLVASKPGVLSREMIHVSSGSKLFLPESEFTMGGVRYVFPGTPDQAWSMINDYQSNRLARGSVDVAPGTRLMMYCDYSGMPCAVTARRGGQLDWRTMVETQDALGRPVTTLAIGTEVIRFELPKEDVKRMMILYLLHQLGGDALSFQAGEVIIRGYAESGDHLFVNRLHLAYCEPRRGDPMVFMTTGLKSTDGREFGGTYYVKRLVGMPGDTLKIQNHRLYVRERGQAAFRLIDGGDHVGFERLYSMKGGYRGYAHMVYNPQLGAFRGGAAYLTSDEDEYTVPEGHYFMMGDNSENSWDSRWFGPVPRENLVGSPVWVWWPFSRRWGRTDSCEPDLALGDTPPTMP